MLLQIAIGSLLMIITTFVHAGCTLAALWALRMTHADRWGLRTGWMRVTLIAALVVMMFLAAILEITIWAATYLVVGAMSALEPALYFSTVTFTTLGYGDVTLNDSWRLMASFEAVNGIILIGWTTALIFAFVRRVASHDDAIAARLDR
ncbi:MAG: two pore domain potassium channel family protein [Deltaproteobacteria bacterium]|nr:two pore domain potassium channel family protein [Deltaproteobacteria bacterium]